MPVYCGLDTDSGLEPYVEEGLIPAPEKVTVDFGNGTEHSMLRYNTIFINITQTFREIQARVSQLGIPLERAEIECFDEIDEPIVFNCTGIGAAKLNQDEKMSPVLGHLLMLKDQPPMQDLQYMIYTEVMQNGSPEYVYFMPKSDFGVIGGTFIPGEERIDDEGAFRLILDRAREFFGESVR